MLPVPVIDFFPIIFKEDPKAIALASKIETALAEYSQDIFGLEKFVRADECNEIFLNELDFYLSSGFQAQDSETIKRKKIYNAILKHRHRSLWADDAKIRIDTITGISPGARVFRGIDSNAWVFRDPITVPSTFYWATLRADNSDTKLGLGLLGAGNEIEIPGNIYVDCHEGINTAVLTASQIQAIIDDLIVDCVPAYFITYLGYVDSTGQFQFYSGGTI